MSSKKENEKFILTKFKESSQIAFKILDVDEAKSIFKNYNGENPDFIILSNKDYVGVELFQLNLKRSKQLQGQLDQKGKQIINLPHLISKNPKNFNNLDEFEASLKNPENYKLTRHDDEDEILIERIRGKILKLNLYITPKIWLLGYATEHYQKIVENIFRDNRENILRQSISGKINILNSIEKIFLFEIGTSYRDFIFKLYDKHIHEKHWRYSYECQKIME